MDRLWLDAPAAALRITRDEHGLQAQPNRAAADWGGRHGVGHAAWRDFGAAAAAGADRGSARLAGIEVRWRRHRLDDGSALCWLEPPADDERVAAARRATEFLDRALVLAGVSLWRIDLDTRRIHFNDVGFDIAGIAAGAQDVPLEALRGTIHPDDLPAIERGAEAAVATGRVVDVIARYRGRDGGWRRLMTRRVADRDEAGRVVGLTGVALDITQQVAERERAEMLADRARLVAETMGVGFWSRDLDGGTAYWDDQMYRIHRRDAAAGPPGFDDWFDVYVHPMDRAWVRQLHLMASRDWQPVIDATFRAPNGPDGAERWVQTWTRRFVRDGRRLAFGMHMDVSDRQRAQMRQQRENARMQFAIDAADIGVWERGVEGPIVYWNEAMYRLRGLAPDDARAADEIAAATTDPDDRARLADAIRRHLDDGAPYRFEFRVRRPDGAWRWLATQGRALRDSAGHVHGMAGVDLDITERKAADALRAEKDRAEQASRDKSAFLARVSHELRTPMNAVLGFAQLLDDDPREQPTPRQRSRLRHIAEAGAQMVALIDDLLDLADIDGAAPAAAPETTALADVVAEVVGTLAPAAAERGIGLRNAAGTGTLRVDRRRLVQALVHVAGHALRRLDGGRSIEIGGRMEAGDGAGPHAVLTVADDGPDYSDAEQAMLFEPFARPGDPERSREGTGIGLSLAQRLAESLGASLDAGPRAGGGNEFRFRLPADAAGAAEAPATTAPARPRLNVLCVEDNPVNLLLVRELLSKRPGVTLQAAADGRSGIERALAEPPDVLLLDLQLPDIGGMDVLKRLRAEPALSGCVFIALSANALPDHIAAARAAGFDDYWTKPIDFERFLAGIDRLAERGAAAD